jgi:hypothetical protein
MPSCAGTYRRRSFPWTRPEPRSTATRPPNKATPLAGAGTALHPKAPHRRLFPIDQGSAAALQPPPSASISATLACRRFDSTVSAVSSAESRVVCAVITLE